MVTLPIVEMFGPTIQGEGPAAGRRAYFFRLGGCNLSCSWCDTPYSWDGQRFDLRKQIKLLDLEEVCNATPGGDGIAVVTGGEPLLHQTNSIWHPFIFRLRQNYLSVHLETNGTIQPVTAWMYQHISVSPKLANAGNHRGNQSAAIWDGWSNIPRAIFKFVVENGDDVGKAIELADANHMPRSRVWVMPQGISAKEINTKWFDIVEAAIGYRINVTHRLHVLAYDNERGH